MKVGYARVSSRGQSLEVQIEKLRAAGCEKVFEEKRSGGKGTARPELAQALEYVREGDALIVTKLDRLARSLSDLSTITGTLSRKEVGFVVLDQKGKKGTLPFSNKRIKRGRFPFRIKGNKKGTNYGDSAFNLPPLSRKRDASLFL